MNKSQSKYFNTAVKMDEAFLKLLEKKEFEYITVKEICDAAGVNRSTFYLHYETVGDLLEETMDFINDKFNAYFAGAKFDVSRIQSLPLAELYLITPEYLVPWLTFIGENVRLFRTFLKRHDTLKVDKIYKDVFTSVISPILMRYGVPEENREYVFLFYVEGIIAVVKQWIREGCVRSVGEITAIITEHIKSNES